MAHLKQALYAKEMTDMMENVKSCWTRFRETAEECSYEKQALMYSMIEESTKTNDRGFIKGRSYSPVD